MSLDAPGLQNWASPGSKIDLLEGQVHIWRIFLDLPSVRYKKYWQLLSDGEKERAASYRFEGDRTRFIARRGILRTILALYLDGKPENILFRLNQFGKPALAGDSSTIGLEFSVSHSGGIALFAFTRRKRSGVDVEKWDGSIDHLLIAEGYFSPIERQSLLALAPGARNQGFFQCWTRKEAFIKACGNGMSIPLEQFDVSLVPGETARLLATRAGLPPADDWVIMDIPAGTNFSAALAAEKPVSTISLWDFGSVEDIADKSK